MIIHQVTEAALAMAKGQTVDDVRIGTHFAAVKLADGSCGISFLLNQFDTVKSALKPGKIIGLPVEDLVSLAPSLNLQDSSLALAAVNALLQNQEFDCVKKNAIEMVEVTKQDKVAMVGQFHQLIKPLSEQSAKLYVFEMNGAQGTYPAWSEPLILPECDVVFLSGTTLINKTMDDILAKCAIAREIVLLGPSVIAMPKIFKPRGVTVLGPCRVTDNQAMLEVVSQGGKGPHIQTQSEMFCIRL